MPDFDQALSKAWLDCGREFHKQQIVLNGACILWITFQVEYKSVNPIANKQPIEQYLSATPTRIFRRDGPVTITENP